MSGRTDGRGSLLRKIKVCQGERTSREFNQVNVSDEMGMLLSRIYGSVSTVSKLCHFNHEGKEISVLKHDMKREGLVVKRNWWKGVIAQADHRAEQSGGWHHVNLIRLMCQVKNGSCYLRDNKRQWVNFKIAEHIEAETKWPPFRRRHLFLSTFCWMKMYEYRLRFRWSLFPRVQLTVFHH